MNGSAASLTDDDSIDKGRNPFGGGQGQRGGRQVSASRRNSHQAIGRETAGTSNAGGPLVNKPRPKQTHMARSATGDRRA